jgi:hypothetical protein
MEYEDEFKKFEDFIVKDSNEVYSAITIQYNCEWDGKKFIIRDFEDTKSRDLVWIEGQEQFTEDEQDEIQEYVWSGALS